MAEYGVGKNQSLLFVDRKHTPAVDVGDIAHDAGAELFAAAHLPEFREIVFGSLFRSLSLIVG